MTNQMAPIVQAVGLGKSFATVVALRDLDLTIRSGEVTCILGDNGAGKSTLIKMLAGVFSHSAGQLLIDGTPRVLTSPRQALSAGIATVYQDLAMVPLLSVWRNFFLGNELTGPVGTLRIREMKRITRAELLALGIDIRDVEQGVGTLSGGERQSVAIARAIHRGARVLILDEPTAALGVKQSGMVLRNIQAARERGIAVIFITHNPQHADLVGDRFVVLNRGVCLGNYSKAEISRAELTHLMAGGSELDRLTEELS